MRNSSERFVCWIWVAPFVRRYLLNNFHVDDPAWPDLVSFASDKSLLQVFRSCLVKGSHRYDNRTGGGCGYRRCRIPVLISQCDFYRYGWSLSSTDEAMLAGMLEARCRMILLTFLGVWSMVTPSVSVGIRMFYEQFGFDSECWPENSIRRIWNRHGGRFRCEGSIVEVVAKRVRGELGLQMSGCGILMNKDSGVPE